MMFFKILLITIVFLALAFAGFAIKMFVKKDGEFKKQCSSVDPNTGQRIGCVCEGEGDGSCENKEKDLISKIKIEPLQIDQS
jgi:hypothetical protein